MVTVPPAFTVVGDTLNDWMLGGVVSLPPVGGGGGGGGGEVPTVNDPSAVGGAGAEITSWLPAASRAPMKLTVQVPEAAASGTVRVACQIPSWGVPDTSEKFGQPVGANWPDGNW
jgi:hypothetical protein